MMNEYASINLVGSEDVIIENNFIEHAYFAIHVANSRHCIIREHNALRSPFANQEVDLGQFRMFGILIHIF